MKIAYRENSWLERLIGKRCYCFLASGICLKGRLIGFDLDALFLGPEDPRSQNQEMMIYKGFVSTVQPWPDGTDAIHRHAVRV